MGGPIMIDLNLIEQTGFRKLIELYNKSKPNGKFCLKDQMRQIMRVVDEQDALSRYNWSNLPEELKMGSDEIERLIYIKGSVCFFWFNKQYHILPFAGEDIDEIGRFTTITPIPMAAESSNNDAQRKLLSDLKLKVFYTVPTEQEIKDAGGKEKIAVIIRDYPCQINAQWITPRWILNEPLLDIEAEIFPMARTARMLATGVKGMVVNENDAKNVDDANDTLEEACMEGKPYIPVSAAPTTKDIQNGNVAKNEEFMQSLQTLENYRLGTYGIQNGGLFQKKAHTLEGEEAMNGGPVSGRMEKGYNCRNEPVKIINKVFDIKIKVEQNNFSTGEFYTADMSNKEGKENVSSDNS